METQAAFTGTERPPQAFPSKASGSPHPLPKGSRASPGPRASQTLRPHCSEAQLPGHPAAEGPAGSREGKDTPQERRSSVP